MRITKSRGKPYKRAVSVLLLVVLCVAVWLGIAFVKHAWPFNLGSSDSVTKPTNTVNYSPASDAQAKEGAATKERVAENSKSDSPTEAQSTSPVIEITSTNISDDTYYIRTLIHTVTNSGTCTLRMVGPQQQSYSASSGVQSMATTSTCQGFNVPLKSLTSGSWKISIEFSDKSSSTTATKEVTI